MGDPNRTLNISRKVGKYSLKVCQSPDDIIWGKGGVNCAWDAVLESICAFRVLRRHRRERRLIIAKNDDLPCRLTFQKMANDALIVTLKRSDFVTYSGDSYV